VIVQEQELERLREENQKLSQLIAQVRDERDTAERKLYNTAWKFAEAEETLQAIEDVEEEMRRVGLLVDALKPNWKQQVRLINDRERRELGVN
jgi:hypothetical protein